MSSDLRGLIHIELDGEWSFIGWHPRISTPMMPSLASTRAVVQLQTKSRGWTTMTSVAWQLSNAYGLHEQGEFNGLTVERVHGGLWHVGIVEVGRWFPCPIEATRARLVRRRTRTNSRAQMRKNPSNAEEIVACELERNAPISVRGSERLALQGRHPMWPARVLWRRDHRTPSQHPKIPPWRLP